MNRSSSLFALLSAPTNRARSLYALAVLVVLASAGLSPVRAQGQVAPAADMKAAAAKQDGAAADDSVPEGKLFLTFEGAPWRDVIQFLAETSGLALHVTDLPTGTFTYNDDSEFTPGGAIDRVNLFLLPEGFTLIRSKGLLSLINLSDRRSAQQLDTLARLITV